MSVLILDIQHTKNAVKCTKILTGNLCKSNSVSQINGSYCV